MKILCPFCKEELKRIDHSFTCINRHSFDLAKQGYLNLNDHPAQSGDSEELIRARRDFLAKDHYLFLKEQVSSLLLKYEVSSLIDLACGEGYYTKDLPAKERCGIDLSRQALKYASQRDKDTFYLRTSIFTLPFEDASFDAVTTLFAPVADKEIARVLKKDGIFLLVRPDEKHLYELKEVLYDKVRENEVKELNFEGLSLLEERHISRTILLPKEDLLSLFHMTPYAVKTSPKDREKLEALKELKIRFGFVISVYKKD